MILLYTVNRGMFTYDLDAYGLFESVLDATEWLNEMGRTVIWQGKDHEYWKWMVRIGHETIEFRARGIPMRGEGINPARDSGINLLRESSGDET